MSPTPWQYQPTHRLLHRLDQPNGRGPRLALPRPAQLWTPRDRPQTQMSMPCPPCVALQMSSCDRMHRYVEGASLPMSLLCPAQQTLLLAAPSLRADALDASMDRPDKHGVLQCVYQKGESISLTRQLTMIHTLRTPPTAHCDRRSEVTRRPTDSGRQASRGFVKACQTQTLSCHGTRADCCKRHQPIRHAPS